jgi:tetratricopeptide (TPR) repeat protein
LAEDNRQTSRLNGKWGEELRRGRDLVEQGKEAEAWGVVAPILLEEPHNAGAIVLATHVLDKARRLPEAYAMARLGASLYPDVASMWTNVARMADQLYLFDECDEASQQAIKIAPPGKVKAMQLMNWGASLINQGRWEESEKLSREALAIVPDLRKALANLGMACLAQGKWREGWAGYKSLIGSEMRKRTQYADEPEWDGSPGKVVVLTGEQGLGDEVSFASMVPDAQAVCKRLIVDCDRRLEGLFRRSFPGVTVYGTRWDAEVDWPEEDRKPDASLLIGQVGQFFRNETSDFPGKPYLKACPIRTAQWVEHFRAQGKVPIGLAWTGGVQWTGGKFRLWELGDLMPVFDAVDGYFVSLQYKDAKGEIARFKRDTGIEVHQFPWATLTKDYDDTAALIAAIGECGGMVVSMQTAVIHLAGALGVPCWVFVHKGGQWRYGVSDEHTPWYGKTVRIFRQTKEHEWAGVIGDAARQLRELYGGTQSMDRVRPERDGSGERSGAQHSAPGKKAGSNLLRRLVANSGVQAPARSAGQH